MTLLIGTKKEPPMNKALSKFIRSKIGMEEE